MRMLVVGCALVVAVVGLFASQYTFAQDEPATPEVYVVDCATPTIEPEASPNVEGVATIDPEVNATIEAEMDLAGMSASPEASPGTFVCASPEATPTS